MSSAARGGKAWWEARGEQVQRDIRQTYAQRDDSGTFAEPGKLGDSGSAAQRVPVIMSTAPKKFACLYSMIHTLIDEIESKKFAEECASRGHADALGRLAKRALGNSASGAVRDGSALLVTAILNAMQRCKGQHYDRYFKPCEKAAEEAGKKLGAKQLAKQLASHLKDLASRLAQDLKAPPTSAASEAIGLVDQAGVMAAPALAGGSAGAAAIADESVKNQAKKACSQICKSGFCGKSLFNRSLLGAGFGAMIRLAWDIGRVMLRQGMTWGDIWSTDYLVDQLVSGVISIAASLAVGWLALEGALAFVVAIIVAVLLNWSWEAAMSYRNNGRSILASLWAWVSRDPARLHTRWNVPGALVLPYSLCCPITHDLLFDPVSVRGLVYERREITQWIDLHGTDPRTRMYVSRREVRCEDEMRALTREYAAAHQLVSTGDP